MNLMIGTLAFEMMATVSAIFACRIALAISDNVLTLLLSVKSFVTTRSMSLRLSVGSPEVVLHQTHPCGRYS